MREIKIPLQELWLKMLGWLICEGGHILCRTLRYIVCWITYPELVFKARYSLPRDDLVQLVHLNPQISGRNVCLPTCDQLFQSIVDEHILGLNGTETYWVCEYNKVLNIYISMTYSFSKCAHISSTPKKSLPQFSKECSLTRVCTMKTRFALMLRRNSYTLTVSSTFILSSMLSSRMKVPVLPTPALQCTSMGGPSLLWIFRTRRMKAMREVANFGTPWSGQPRKW